MSVSLRGNLNDFGIADVFQLIGQQRKTGVLHLSGVEGAVELRFDGGSVVTAAPATDRPHGALGDMLVRCGVLSRVRVDRILRECEASAQSLARVASARGLLSEERVSEIEELLTRDSIFEVLRWSGGSFDFTACAVEHTRPPESLLGAEQILMDGLRMVDEWQSFADDVESEYVVFACRVPFDSYREHAGREAERRLAACEIVFRLIDGRRTVRQIVDQSGLGNFDGTRVLADLVRAGAIEAVGRVSSRAPEEDDGDAISGGGWRYRAAAAVSLALLAITTAMAFRTGSPDSIADALRIEANPLARAYESFATRRLRHALEVERLDSGSWPANLDALTGAGVIADLALASGSGRAYYYALREDGVVLLAPER